MDNKSKQKKYRARIKASDLKEIRGLYCSVDKHDEFKARFKKEIEK